MLVTLGKKQRAEGVAGRLLECHDRIRRFVDMVARLGATEQLTDDEVRSAARDIHRYFSEALPLHVQDEEKSLVPRLRGRDPALDAALERMEQEHRTHEPLVASLLSICERLERTALKPDSRHVLMELAPDLERELGIHLEEEETIVFPAIDRHLEASEQAEILAEMTQRRQRD